MAAASVNFLFFFQLISLISGTFSSHNPVLPKAAILQVTKDATTLQYTSNLFMGQDLEPVKLVVDLNAPSVWVDRESKSPVKSCSLECSMAKSTNGCWRPIGRAAEQRYKTCTLQAENTVTRMSTSAEVNEDAMAVEFWDGMSLLGSFARNEQFLFSCAPNLLLKGLASGAKGMLGLGNSRISLPSQFSTKFGFFERKFSMCLSSSTDGSGAIFLGGNPHEVFSKSMVYTPLVSLKNGYYINVNSIKVSGKKVPIFHQNGHLGAKMSTIVPYTTLESKIYGTFVKAYVEAAVSMNLTLVPPVTPFGVCFSTWKVDVPVIDLVLQSEMVNWRINGRNSMVHVSDEVMCLGFLDGGLSPKDSIVIGGYQMEDNLLEFNLGNSMLGFSSSLLVGDNKKCSDFGASNLQFV